MAKKVENKKGFLILEVSRKELQKVLGGYTLGICDCCGEPADNGYYIAALNQWFCEGCLQEWLQRAERYVQDIPTEENNYNFYEEYFRKAQEGKQ